MSKSSSIAASSSQDLHSKIIRVAEVSESLKILIDSMGDQYEHSRIISLITILTESLDSAFNYLSEYELERGDI